MKRSREGRLKAACHQAEVALSEFGGQVAECMEALEHLAEVLEEEDEPVEPIQPRPKGA